MKIKYLSIALLLLSACSTSKKSTTSSSVSTTNTKATDTAPSKVAPVTTATVKDVVSIKELEDGKKLYLTHCNSCHSMKAPFEYTAEQWNRILPIMSKKAKIDDATQASIRKYLLASCK